MFVFKLWMASKVSLIGGGIYSIQRYGELRTYSTESDMTDVNKPEERGLTMEPLFLPMKVLGSCAEIRFQKLFPIDEVKRDNASLFN